MITNINTLQHPTEDLQTVTDVYLKQSLANLGQRFSIKGDGLQTGELNLYEMFLRDYDKAIDEKAYCKIVVDNDSPDDILNVSLQHWNGDELVEAIPLSGISWYKTTESFSLDGSPINGVTKYRAGGIINKLPDSYIITLIGEDSSGAAKEIICEEHAITPSAVDRLVNGLRIAVYDGELRLSHITKSYDEEHKYLFSLYKMNDMTTVGEAVSLLFADPMSGDTFIYGHEDELTPRWLLNKLDANGYVSAITVDNKVEARVTDANDMYFNSGASFKYSGYLVEFMYDVNRLYDKCAEYYNERVYFVDDSSLGLKKQLLLAIITKLYRDYVHSSSFIDDPDVTFYLPYVYKLIYSCNSNDASQIYNSIKDVCIRYTVAPERSVANLIGEDAEQIIICKTPDLDTTNDKFGVYNYNITYTRDNIVDDITVEKVYTLPYIDNNGYWCINDIVTDIYARGKDGGQPNIIITYNDASTGKHDVLSSFRRDEITQLDWTDTKYMAKPLDSFTNVGKHFYHMMDTKMPTNISYLNENLVTMLENAVILNIDSVMSEDVEHSNSMSYLSEDLGSNAVVATFWVLSKERKPGAKGSDLSDFDYNFSYVKQPGEAWALDMNYLNNTELLVKHYMQYGIEPDNYEHTWLVFDPINTTLKNNTSDSKATVWPVIRNYTQAEMNEVGMYGDVENTSTMYVNDLNLMVGFFDGITKAEGTGYINAIKMNDTRYFMLDESGKTAAVTNYTDYLDEWIPNASKDSDTQIADSMVPVLDLAETFIRNENVMNRVNVVSFDKDKNVYNSYFGVSYVGEDKSIIRLGTSYTNINVGTQTVITKEQSDNFIPQSELAIDFNQITLNGWTSAARPIWVYTGSSDGTTRSYAAVAYPNRLGVDAVDCTGDDETMDFAKMSDALLGFRTWTEFKGSLRAPSRKANECWMNLTFYLKNILEYDVESISSITSANNTIEEHDVSYFLRLSTDVTAQADGHKSVNPLYMTYFGSTEQTWNIDEMITSESRQHYNVGEL